MAEIVNLRTARKQAARAAARHQGDASAAESGLSKPEKRLAKARADKAARDLDGHRRSDLPEGVTPPDILPPPEG
jgi:phage protein D